MQTPVQILHLEADLTDAEAVREILERLIDGFQLSLCRTGDEFLTCLCQHKYDLILSDNQIPGCDGSWVLRQVQEQYPDLPVIFVTSTEGEAAAIETLGQGAADYVLKTNLARLPTTVKRALRDAESRKARKQTETALRISEARYQALVDHQSDLITRSDLSGNTTFVNETWCRAFGKSGEQVIGTNLALFVFPDDIPILMQAIEAVQLPPHYIQFEIRQLMPDGSLHWFGWECSAILDEAGTILEWQTVGRDITRQKQTDAALSETRSSLEKERNLLRTLIDSVPDYIFVKDRQGRFILSNAQHNLSTGATTSDSLIGKTALDLYQPELGQRFHADDLRVMESGEALINAERQTIGPDGAARWVLTNKIPLKSADGQIGGVIGISRNITERKKAEEALRESEARFRTIFEGSAIGIALVAAQGQITETNPAMEQMFGYSRDEIRTMTFIQITHPDDVDRDWILFQELSAGIRDTYQMEKRYFHKDGHLIWGHLTVSAIRDAQLRSRFVIGMVEDITERKEAEAALAEERNLLRTLIDTLPDNIFIKDTEGRIINDNIAHRRGLGVTTLEQVVGKTDFDFFPVELAGAYFADEQAIVQSGKPLLNKEEPTIEEGASKWLLTTKIPLYNSQKSLIGIVGINRDITERKRIEQAERDQRLLAEALRDTSAALASTLDPTTVMNNVLLSISNVVPHDAADLMLIEDNVVRIVASHGYSSESGKGLNNFLFSLDSPSFREMLETRMPFLIPDTRSYSDWVVVPESAWIRSYINAPIEVRGELIGFLNLNSAQPDFFTAEHSQRLQAFVDIVGMAIENARLYEQLQHHVDELALRVDERTLELDHAREHVEAILDSTSDAILVIQADGTVQRTNPSFNRLFGYQADEIIAQPLAVLAAPEFTKPLLTALNAAVQIGTSSQIEVQVRRKDVTTFSADISLSPVRHSGMLSTSNAAEIVCSIRDITERKLVESELQLLNQLKTEFLSTAAHELRTPLASILGFSEILLNRTLDGSRSKHFIEIIHEQSIQLRKIIDALLDISRIESKEKLLLDLQPINIKELITQTLAGFEDDLSTHEIEVKALVGHTVVIGDPFRLGQVLQNLLSNAIKYSPSGGLITIRVEMLPGKLKISVQDHGIGMNNEQQRHLFERFYRADASNTTISGTGLGLAISKLIIELHNGQIWAESEYQVGTTVSFTLPMEIT